MAFTQKPMYITQTGIKSSSTTNKYNSILNYQTSHNLSILNYQSNYNTINPCINFIFIPIAFHNQENKNNRLTMHHH